MTLFFVLLDDLSIDEGERVRLGLPEWICLTVRQEWFWSRTSRLAMSECIPKLRGDVQFFRRNSRRKEGGLSEIG